MKGMLASHQQVYPLSPHRKALPIILAYNRMPSQGREHSHFQFSKFRELHSSKVERNEQHMFLNIHKGWSLTSFGFLCHLLFVSFLFILYATAANENNHTITQVK